MAPLQCRTSVLGSSMQGTPMWQWQEPTPPRCLRRWSEPIRLLRSYERDQRAEAERWTHRHHWVLARPSGEQDGPRFRSFKAPLMSCLLSPPHSPTAALKFRGAVDGRYGRHAAHSATTTNATPFEPLSLWW